jgi:hypothetical protein
MSIPPKRSAVASQSATSPGDDALEPEVVAAARGEPEVAAAVVQHARHRGADAAARAGDHRGLAVQVGHVPSSGLSVG